MQDRDAGLLPKSGEPSQADEATDATGDILAGLLFSGVGLLVLYLGRAYPTGSALDMGPGYLPRIVAGALVLIGLVIIARAVRRRLWALPPFPVWSMVWIGVSILLFAVLIERAGLFLACLACVGVAAAADAQVRWREVPVVSILLSGFCAVLFGYVLRLSVQVWPL